MLEPASAATSSSRRASGRAATRYAADADHGRGRGASGTTPSQIGTFAEAGCHAGRPRSRSPTRTRPSASSRAATAAGLPVVVGFTVETDGRLPSGESIEEAIVAVDAATDGAGRVLHDQLRPPDALRGRAARRRRRASGSAGCARTPRRSATPSSTRRRSSTRAIRPTSPSGTSRSARDAARARGPRRLLRDATSAT